MSVRGDTGGGTGPGLFGTGGAVSGVTWPSPSPESPKSEITILRRARNAVFEDFKFNLLSFPVDLMSSFSSRSHVSSSFSRSSAKSRNLGLSWGSGFQQSFMI